MVATIEQVEINIVRLEATPATLLHQLQGLLELLVIWTVTVMVDLLADGTLYYREYNLHAQQRYCPER